MTDTATRTDPAPRARVWSSRSLSHEATSLLETVADLVISPVEETPAWYAEIATCDGMILDGITVIDAARLERFGSRLRVIARTGIGVDRIKLTDATAFGVLIANTPDGPTESTAEHAVALMMALAKQVAISDRELRSGAGFTPYGVLRPGLELKNATLGLIGLGRIGGRVAEIAKVLGMHVIAFDPFITPERAANLTVELRPTLADVLQAADVVSIHCPSIPATYRLINADTLALMKPGSYLINVSRGAIIDEAALVAALSNGHLAGAGLDVFDPEPTIANHPFFSLPNTICTAHIGSYTNASIIRMEVMACEQVIQALRGERPTCLVNADVWGKQRHSTME